MKPTGLLRTAWLSWRDALRAARAHRSALLLTAAALAALDLACGGTVESVLNPRRAALLVEPGPLLLLTLGNILVTAPLLAGLYRTLSQQPAPTSPVPASPIPTSTAPTPDPTPPAIILRTAAWSALLAAPLALPWLAQLCGAPGRAAFAFAAAATATYLQVRLCLVLPDIATGRHAGAVRRSWRLTAGRTLWLVRGGLLVGLPVLLPAALAAILAAPGLALPAPPPGTLPALAPPAALPGPAPPGALAVALAAALWTLALPATPAFIVRTQRSWTTSGDHPRRPRLRPALPLAAALAGAACLVPDRLAPAYVSSPALQAAGLLAVLLAPPALLLAAWLTRDPVRRRARLAAATAMVLAALAAGSIDRDDATDLVDDLRWRLHAASCTRALDPTPPGLAHLEWNRWHDPAPSIAYLVHDPDARLPETLDARAARLDGIPCPVRRVHQVAAGFAVVTTADGAAWDSCAPPSRNPASPAPPGDPAIPRPR